MSLVHSNEPSYSSYTILSAQESAVEKTATISESIINFCTERTEGQARSRLASTIRATFERGLDKNSTHMTC